MGYNDGKGEAMSDYFERVSALHLMANDPRTPDGERENAKTALVKLMKKYNLTEADFDDKQTELVVFGFKTDYDRKLVCQIIYAMLGYDDYKEYAMLLQGRKQRNKVAFYLTKVQKAEAEHAYEWHKRNFAKEVAATYEAYLQVHRIFPQDKSRAQQISNEEWEELCRRTAAIGKERLTKALGDGK